MTTTPPILTGPPPAPEYCGYFDLLPTVGWSLRMLQWVGWTYCETSKVGGYRSYNLIDPAGLGVYLTTYGLRREAMRMHIQYGLKSEKNLDFPFDNTPGF